MRKLLDIFPGMEVGEDNDGQLIVYTNTRLKDGWVVTMEDEMTDRPNTRPAHVVYHADEYGFSITWTGWANDPIEVHDGGYNEPVKARYATSWLEPYVYDARGVRGIYGDTGDEDLPLGDALYALELMARDIAEGKI